MNVTPSRSFISAFVTLHSYCLSVKRFSREEQKVKKKKKKRNKRKKEKEEGGKRTIIESDINWFCITISSTASLVYFTFRPTSDSFFLSFICFSNIVSALFPCIAILSQEWIFRRNWKRDTKMPPNKSIYCQLTRPGKFTRSRPLEYFEKFRKTSVRPDRKYLDRFAISIEMISHSLANKYTRDIIFSCHWNFDPLYLMINYNCGV